MKDLVLVKADEIEYLAQRYDATLQRNSQYKEAKQQKELVLAQLAKQTPASSAQPAKLGKPAKRKLIKQGIAVKLDATSAKQPIMMLNLSAQTAFWSTMIAHPPVNKFKQLKKSRSFSDNDVHFVV